jgi:molybdopterin/thiamine biosynthesis adenylyltransferase
MSQDKIGPTHRASRHLPIAQALTGEDERIVLRKFEQPVLLTGDRLRLRTRAGRLMLDVAANLISRFCRHIDLSFGIGLEKAEEEVRQLLLGIDSALRIRRVADCTSERYAAILSIGSVPWDVTRVTAIDASGWVARVSGAGKLPIRSELEDANPFGALAAAALGAAEVFKHVLKIRREKGGFFGETSFSTYDYGVATDSVGPSLPERLILPSTLLAGVGAVGNAFLLALAQVPGLSGKLVVVDKEFLDDSSNLNRYALAREADVRPENPLPKTTLATRLFAGTNVSVRPLQMDVKEIARTIERVEMPRPDVIISALDNNPSRYEIQDLWPDLLLEGATSETLLQVSRHEYDTGLACLRCLHPELPASPVSYEERIRQFSGLRADWIRAAGADPKLPLTAEALPQADHLLRDLLSQHVGKPACSVLAEIEALSTRPLAELPIQPAVSFVSAMAGILVAAEYVKYLMHLSTSLKTFFQTDLMFPLKDDCLQEVQKVSSCYCVERKDIIARYRQGRS